MALAGVLTAQTSLFWAGILHTKQHRILRLWEKVTVLIEHFSHHTTICQHGWWHRLHILGWEQATSSCHVSWATLRGQYQKDILGQYRKGHT